MDGPPPLPQTLLEFSDDWDSVAPEGVPYPVAFSEAGYNNTRDNMSGM